MPPEALPRLFEKFYRVPRKGEGSRRGTGIGLAVVQGIVEAMGGKVEGDREHAGRPRDRVRPAGRVAVRVGRVGDVSGAQGAAVLLVEDDDATREVDRHLPRRPRPSRSTKPPTSPRRPRPGSGVGPDIIVLDLGLPDEDGLVVIRHVRREAATPILVLSARDRESDKVAALDLGADDYVTKPFGMVELRARIDALLRRAAGPAADDRRGDPDSAT